MDREHIARLRNSIAEHERCLKWVGLVPVGVDANGYRISVHDRDFNEVLRDYLVKKIASLNEIIESYGGKRHDRCSGNTNRKRNVNNFCAHNTKN